MLYRCYRCGASYKKKELKKLLIKIKGVLPYRQLGCVCGCRTLVTTE